MNNINRRQFSKLLATASAMAVLPRIATAQSVEGPLRVAWWGDTSRSEATQAAIDLFSAANPSAAVESEFVGFQAYLQRLSTQLAGGGAPDLIQLSSSRVRQFSEGGALADLRPYIDSGALDVSAIDPSVFEYGTVDGRVVTLMAGVSAAAVIANVSKIEELGFEVSDGTWGWDEFAEQAKAISDAGGEGYWGTADGGGYRQVLEVLVQQRGRTFYNAEGQIGFTPEDLTDHFNYWDALRKNGAAVSPQEQAVFQDQLEGLPVIRGIAAYDFSFSSILSGLSNMSNDTLAAVMLPIDGAENTGQGAFEGLSWSITEQSENKDAAVALLSFMINDPGAIEALQYVRGISPSSKVREMVEAGMSDEARESSGSAYITRVMENPTSGKPLDPAGASAVGPLLRKINEQISFEQSTVEEGVEEFFRQAARELR